MIRPGYAVKLAKTKLKSKRVMLLASIVVASLLFAILIAGVIVFTAANKSASQFVKEANNNRYLVKVSSVIPLNVTSFGIDLTLEDIHDIKAFEKNYYDNLQAKYKQLGLKYDASTEVHALQPSAWKPNTLPEEQRVDVNYTSPVVQEMLTQKYEQYLKTAKNKLSDLKKVGDKYGGFGYYTKTPFPLEVVPNQMLIRDGKEDFSDRELKGGDMTLSGYLSNAIHNSTYEFVDASLLNRYLLTADTSAPKGIPVVVSAQELVTLFGKTKNLTEEPNNPNEKAAWLKDVQQKMKGFTYQTCYRNSSEMAKVEKLQRDYAEIANNKNNKDYMKPSLVYDLPSSTCGEVTVKSDNRTAAEKVSDLQAIDTQKKLGTYIAPVRQIITYQVVGVINAQPYSKYTDNIQSYLKNLLSVQNDTSSALIPRQMYDSLPTRLKVDSIAPANIKKASERNPELLPGESIVAFNTIEQARQFMQNETCPGMDTNCKKLYMADAYGSNYLILDEIGKLFQKLMTYTLPAVLALASIIIWFTMSRIMAENRKETAIYRAMGAKRRDIVAIYLTYSMMIALNITVFSLIIGIVAAYVVDFTYSGSLTSAALSSFGVIKAATKFRLFDLSSPLIPLILVSIFVISLMAIIQPLVRNVLRSPVDDMRND